MKTRVASIVTLLTLILVGFLLIQSCTSLANDTNEAARTEVNIACDSIGAALEGNPSEGRAALLQEFLESDPELGCELYAADETLVFGSRRINAEGKEEYVSEREFQDGGKLILSKYRVTGLEVLLNNSLVLIVALVTIALLAYVVFALESANRKVKLAKQVMKAVDAFSESRFDARIEPVHGKEREVDEYNAIFGRMQDRVQKQASRNNALSVVMNQMQNGIIAVDENLRVMLVTPVAKKLLGIIGNPEGKLIAETSNDVNLDDVFKEAMQQGGVYTNEVAARTAVGRGHRPLRLYVSPMRNDGRVVGALAMVEDITEIRRLERVRTDFAANVSHELKTPLTSIRGFVETLENGAIDNPPMAHKFLKIIMLETERLTRLINDILSITKLESGNDEVTIQRLRIDKMAYDVADMLSIHASEKEVTINCHENETPVYIMGNSDRVEQMLINLVENAIKYNNPGGSVTVQVFSNGVEANIAISDTGIGIAEENLPRLFERFYRVDKGRSRQMGGTGLGLAIVKHIVRSMNGEIEVHSHLGEGTEFLITLPLAPKGEDDEPEEI